MAKGAAGAIGVVQRLRRKRRAVPAELVAGRIRIVGVAAEFTPIVSLLIVQLWRVGGERVRGRLVAEGTAVGAKRIVHSIRRKGTSLPEWIGGGVQSEGIERSGYRDLRLELVQ